MIRESISTLIMEYFPRLSYVRIMQNILKSRVGRLSDYIAFKFENLHKNYDTRCECTIWQKEIIVYHERSKISCLMRC